jgi:hypothetical protein
MIFARAIASAPDWSFIVIALLIPMAWAVRRALLVRRALRRGGRGLCERCGYDVRGGHERCPECGRELRLKPTADAATGASRRSRSVAALGLLTIAVGAIPPTAALGSRLFASRSQKLADSLSWRWDAGEASIDFCVAHLPPGCAVDFATVEDPIIPYLKITLIRDGRQVYGWKGHRGTVFVCKADAFVYASYSDMTPGCDLVAVDLNSGGILWTADVGPFVGPNSRYENGVILELRGDTVVAWGNESFGQYVTVVDLHSGQVLGQHIFSGR